MMQKDSSNQSNKPKKKPSEQEVSLGKQLAEQQSLVELFKSKPYQELLRPFLFNLAQEGYPQPKDFKSNEALILAYTEKVGGTNVVKEIVGFIETAPDRVADITKRLDTYQNEFNVGA